MNAVSSKTFKSGNSVAVRLPKSVGFSADMNVTIECNGDVLTIRPAVDPAEEKRKVLDLVASLRKLGPIGEIEKREPPMPPIRKGL